MSIIHMSTEDVCSAVARMQQQQALLMVITGEIRRQLAGLDSSWQGGTKDEFTWQSQELVLTLTQRLEELERLISACRTEIQQWEDVDNHWASFYRGFSRGYIQITAGVQVPFSAGWQPFGFGTYLIPFPIGFGVQFLSLIHTLPEWLEKKFANLFPPPPVISPLPDESQPVAEEPPMVETPPQPVILPQETPDKYRVFYEVPTKSQSDLYDNAACTPTSISMVLDYWHQRDDKNVAASPEKLISMLEPGDGVSGKGIGLTKMVDDLNELGYNNITVKANSDFASLEGALKEGPVIVTAGVGIEGLGTIRPNVPRNITGPGNSIHAMVITGITNDGQVVINDPWTGKELTYSQDVFNKMWSGGQNCYVSIRP